MANTNMQRPFRGDRALDLLEAGISTSAIMERLGFHSVQAVNAQIKKARMRREKEQETAE